MWIKNKTRSLGLSYLVGWCVFFSHYHQLFWWCRLMVELNWDYKWRHICFHMTAQLIQDLKYSVRLTFSKWEITKSLVWANLYWICSLLYFNFILWDRIGEKEDLSPFVFCLNDHFRAYLILDWDSLCHLDGFLVLSFMLNYCNDFLISVACRQWIWSTNSSVWNKFSNPTHFSLSSLFFYFIAHHTCS